MCISAIALFWVRTVQAHAGEYHGPSSCYGSIMMGAVSEDGTLYAADWKAQRFMLVRDGKIDHEWTVGSRARVAQEREEDNQYLAIGQSGVWRGSAVAFRLVGGTLLQMTHINTSTGRDLKWYNVSNCGRMPKIRTKDNTVVLLDVSSGMVYDLNETSYTCSTRLNVLPGLEAYGGATMCKPGDGCYLGDDPVHNQDYVKVWSFDFDDKANVYWFYTQQKSPRATVIVQYNVTENTFTNITDDLWAGTVREKDNSIGVILHPYGDVFDTGDDWLLVIVSEVDLQMSLQKNYPQRSDYYTGKIISVPKSGRSAPRICGFGVRHAWSSLYYNNTLYLADVGVFDWEEINVISSPCDKTVNLMWPVLEGYSMYYDHLSYHASEKYVEPIGLKHCDRERCPDYAFAGWIMGPAILLILVTARVVVKQSPLYGITVLSLVLLGVLWFSPIGSREIPTYYENVWLWQTTYTNKDAECLETILGARLRASRWLVLVAIPFTGFLPLIGVCINVILLGVLLLQVESSDIDAWRPYVLLGLCISAEVIRLVIVAVRGQEYRALTTET